MKKCWNEVPLNRPSSEEVLDIIEKWIFLPYGKKIEDINEELKCNVLEFINAPIGHNKLATKSHPKASYTSLLSNFTNKELNKIPESEDSQAYHSNLTKLLDVNNSAKLNEILESEMSMNNCNLNDYFYMD
ncbi:kinase-like domain-containing protein [Rhizophagus irregularis DAOM 181602=DAOM 197198]|nr:kinase-like domain-containing protein [Rhizophagus irregularis DAOM 181602=DAOM 197198]